MEQKDSQIYSLPPEMSNILSATIAQTSQGDVILCHDSAYLYAAKVVRGGGNVTFQKFALASVGSLLPVIKNYFMAVLQGRRLVVFEVGFSEQGKISLKFIFNRERPFASLFLRQVAENMAELHICFPDNQIVVHQFTVNGKVGLMNYVINGQNKLSKCERTQLYGSKSLMSLHRRTIYYFTNFSNKFVSSLSLAKLQNDLAAQYGAFPLAYLSKLEEFYVLLSNFHVVNVINPTLHHRLYCEEKQVELVQRLVNPREIERYRVKDGSGLRVSTYFDMTLIEDAENGISYIFQIKPKGSNLIGLEYGRMNWFWTGGRKLVGLALNRGSFKIIDQIKINQKIQTENPFYSSLYSQSRKDFKFKEIEKSDVKQEEINSKNIIKEDVNTHSCSSLGKQEKKPIEQSPQKSQQVLVQKFKPMKIIQKNKVSVSKTIHKSKEIQPISQQQNQNNGKEEKGKEEKEKEAEPQIQAQIQPQPQQPQQESIPPAQPDSKNESIDQLLIEQEYEKMANAVLDQNEPQVQYKKETRAQPQPSPQEIQQNQEDSDDEASCEEVQPKKEGDIYPKEESELSDSLVLPDKMEENNGEQQQLAVPPPAPAEESDAKEESKQESLPKSLAVLIGKSNLGGEYSHPLNLFNTSINRNNIFSSLFGKHQKIAVDQTELRRYRSEEEYYNPFTSTSPCLSPKKEEKQQTQQQEEEDERELQREAAAGVVTKVKELFEDTTNKLLKVVDDLANLKSSEPYLKDKTVQQIKRSVRELLQKLMVGQFTSRIERFFYEIFRQTDAVQQQSIKFYKEANSHKASNIEVQLNNQEKIIKEIKDIESNLRFTITHLKDSNRVAFESFIRDWQREAAQTRKAVDSLNAVKAKIEAEEQAKAKRYEQTKQSLEAIKILLTERISNETEKKQRKIERQKQKQLIRQTKSKKEKEKTKRREKKVGGKK